MQAIEQKPKRKYTPRVKVTKKPKHPQIPSRKEVMEFIAAYGGKTFYSGKLRKLFIAHTQDASAIEEKVISEYGFVLPFSLASKN